MIKIILVNIFIGEKNKKYLNRYLLIILVAAIFNDIFTDFLKGTEISYTSVKEVILIHVILLILGFRVWVGIFEGTQKLIEKILMLRS
tara:strand:- start:152 stop:415 length:264 start_codon:yes stop_codon:yes gene_type:complete